MIISASSGYLIRARPEAREEKTMPRLKPSLFAMAALLAAAAPIGASAQYVSEPIPESAAIGSLTY